MSNQEMASRIHDILSEKAVMGMGRRKKTAGELEDIMEIYGRGVAAGIAMSENGGVMAGGVRAGRGSKKGAHKNLWIEFLKGYASDNGISYRDALQDPNAKAEYCHFYKQYLPEEYQGRFNQGCLEKGHKKKSASKVYKPITTKGNCPRGKKIKKIRGYTTKTGKVVPSYEKCVAAGYIYQ